MTTKRRGHRIRAGAVVATTGLVVGGVIWTAGGASTGAEQSDGGWPVAASVASAAGTTAGPRADLVVTTREIRSAGVDLEPRGDSPGDFFHFEELLFRPGTNRVIGRDAVRCELGIRTFQCNATIRINGKGKIVIDGALMSESDNVIPVTGGTGRFAGVGGTLRVLESGARTRLVFDFVR